MGSGRGRLLLLLLLFFVCVCVCVRALLCLFIYFFSFFVCFAVVSENVALHKPCKLSTVYSTSSHPYKNPCGAAINGNINTRYEPGNCIHTDLGDQHPEWTVYLGQDYAIQKISIYARGGSHTFTVIAHT